MPVGYGLDFGADGPNLIHDRVSTIGHDDGKSSLWTLAPSNQDRFTKFI
ncbi:MAG TPA: hypothetical protein VEV85_00160 [Bryobacteraceae bacterium]|nr:hypothetical protein [Bryobacteraceae bacterium]